MLEIFAGVGATRRVKNPMHAVYWTDTNQQPRSTCPPPPPGDEAIYDAAQQRGYNARKLDNAYSDTNDISKPWGFLKPGSTIILQSVVTQVSPLPPIRCLPSRLALLYIRRLRVGGLCVMAPVCLLSVY